MISDQLKKRGFSLASRRPFCGKAEEKRAVHKRQIIGQFYFLKVGDNSWCRLKCCGIHVFLLKFVFCLGSLVGKGFDFGST